MLRGITPMDRVQPADTSEGRRVRRRLPREEHALWTPPRDRADPLAILADQEHDRLPALIPIRYARMAASPFAFLRGAAAVMAADLAKTPATGVEVQLAGDAHLANFGVYASPERTLLFDLNDFDETHPGPWEWDVKRLAASAVVAGRANGFGRRVCREAAKSAVRAYRLQVRALAEEDELTVWYAHIGMREVVARMQALGERRSAHESTRRKFEQARRRTSLQAAERLTERVRGHRRFLDDPPLLVRVGLHDEERVAETFRCYARTLQDDRRHLLTRFEFRDVAHKVVGVGSVGTRCFLVLLEGRSHGDPLVLQLKQANASVLSAHLGHGPYRSHGHRVVAGQRLLQAVSDIFLGWQRSQGGYDFYWRQYRDANVTMDVEALEPDELLRYSQLCGWALAQAHARAGTRRCIAAYLGGGPKFDRAIADFAEAYADQTEDDHARLVGAIRAGRIAASEPDTLH